MEEEISQNGNIGELGEKDRFISMMILNIGLNPEQMVRRVEETGEKVDYKLGGISIFRDGGEIVARVDNYYVSGKPVVYRWEHERGN